MSNIFERAGDSGISNQDIRDKYDIPDNVPDKMVDAYAFEAVEQSNVATFIEQGFSEKDARVLARKYRKAAESSADAGMQKFEEFKKL